MPCFRGPPQGSFASPSAMALRPGAGRRSAGAAHRVLGYPCTIVDPVGQIDAPTIGSMIRDGYGGPDTCHALCAALCRTDTAGMPILLTDDEDRYLPGTLAIGIDSPGMPGFH